MKETIYMKKHIHVITIKLLRICLNQILQHCESINFNGGKNVVRLHIGSLRKRDASLHGYVSLFLTRLLYQL